MEYLYVFTSSVLDSGMRRNDGNPQGVKMIL